MIKICYVILHYLTEKDTSECINSILNNNIENFEIVVVDNYSNNGSLEKLEENYSENPRLHFISSNANVGFARGNNLGINFARKNFDPDFIIVLNNDTLLLDTDLEKKLYKTFEETNFAVLGPRIVTADGRTDSNPYFTLPLNTISELKRRIRDLNKKILLLKLGLGPLIKKIRKFQGKLPDSGTYQKENKSTSTEIEYNVMLHGSCLIFSRNFFEFLDGFFPGTFLFLEEDILYYQLQKNKLLSVFDPNITIYHKEDAATNLAWQDKNMDLQKLKYLKQSTKAFLKLIEKDENNRRFKN